MNFNPTDKEINFVNHALEDFNKKSVYFIHSEMHAFFFSITVEAETIEEQLTILLCIL